MSLVINHNMMAMNTARNLNNTYGRLSSSVERLSSGLRINSAADDAAGLAIRELMRADITTMQQGVRNAADAISMIQTADGGMAVIDEKLTRMKELAEQAATGTYTTLQREIINSEYQAMAAEIDRIASATNFNGVKLLDGSITNLHGGQGMKIHFGVGNKESEDYYFINTGDVRATSSTGLRIGGDAKNDIWGQGAAGSKGLSGPGCCTAGYTSLDGIAGFTSGQTFSYGYNWDWMEDDDPDLLSGRYLAGRYTVGSSWSLQDLIDEVNRGTQSRVGIKLDGSALATAIKEGGTAAVCIGEEAYIFGSASIAGGTVVNPAVEGLVYKYLANGSYDDDQFLYNAATGFGFGLTQDQRDKLEAAGLDLAKLALQIANVSGSASSTVTSAAAKAALVLNLQQAWAALGLNSLSALSITSGDVAGLADIITSAIVRANATTSIVDPLTGQIIPGQTLDVHTGVYVDSAGNWTNDKRVASALGLEEVVFHVRNEDQVTWSYPARTYDTGYHLSASNTGIVVTDSISTKLGAVGINVNSLLGLAEKQISTSPVANQPTSAAALNALYDDFSAKWAAEMSGYTQRLDFRVDNGSTFVAPSQAAIGAALTASGNEDGANPGTLLCGTSFTVNTGYYVDANGNWTNDQNLVALFPAGTFEALTYVISRATGSYDYTAQLSKGSTALAGVGPITIAGSSPNPPSLSSVKTALSDTALRTGFATWQSAQGSGRGQLFFDPMGSVTMTPPKKAELRADPNVGAPVPKNPDNDLTVTVEINGQAAKLASLAAPLPKTTTVADLGGKLASSLTREIQDAWTAATTAGFIKMGRILTSAASAPSGPAAPANVDNLTIDRSIFSGTPDYYLATGSFDDTGYRFTSAAGLEYGLTSAQFAILSAAGVDLSQLGLSQAFLSASATSTVSSAEALNALLTKLQTLWTQLGLSNLSAITLTAGTTGTPTIDVDTLLASARAAGVLRQSADGKFYLNEQQSFVGHTGVYADANGNWTTDADLAKDLGLTEITYTVANENYSWATYNTTFKSPNHVTSGGLMMTSATSQSLATAFGGTAPGNFVSASASAFGSAATSAAAFNLMYQNMLTEWASKYGTALSEVLFASATTSLGDAASIPLVTAAQALLSGSTASNLTDGSTSGKVIDGQNLTIHTGVYYNSAAGVWTTDQAVASALGLDEITYNFANAGGTLTTTRTFADEINVTQSPNPPLNGNSTVQDFMDYINSELRTIVDTDMTTGGQPAPGRAYLSAAPGHPTTPSQTALEDPIYSTLAIDTTTTSTSPYRTQNVLDISISLPGMSDPWRFTNLSPNPQSVFTSMSDLAAEISLDIVMALGQAQSAANLIGITGQGQLSKADPTPAAGPAGQNDIDNPATEVFYKPASNEETVTSKGIIDQYKFVTTVATIDTDRTNAQGISNFGAWALASAINHNPNSQFWAMIQSKDSTGNSADMVYVFSKKGGDNNHLLACDVADGDVASQAALLAIEFENAATARMTQDGTSFSLGGEEWAKFKPVQTRAGQGKEVWNLTLNGRDVGKERDLWIAAVSNGENEVKTPGLTDGIINGLDRYSFVEIQDADNGPWVGAEVRTQSAAQEALDALNTAMERKDKVRADIGALQNRLENTITNLEIQIESLQASESRISDVDVATEMTEFVRNQVLAQAAVSMLSQANSLPQMALSLLNA